MINHHSIVAPAKDSSGSQPITRSILILDLGRPTPDFFAEMGAGWIGLLVDVSPAWWYYLLFFLISGDVESSSARLSEEVEDKSSSKKISFGTSGNMAGFLMSSMTTV